ncbi:permease [Hydrogenimonas urashimensis]|uniref:permease n=1 Tax=Hydrogenimonas urashimensis TaxID=2740515 RepID=UPI0019156B61|nr:permease [Hydrogenimonas urashimensis]
MFGWWQKIVDGFVYGTLGLDPNSAAGSALDFFLFDTVKILLLLTVIIFLVTFVRSYFPVEKVRDWLADKHQIVGYVTAALFGIITPFCTCSAIPLFLGFLQARIPLGVTFSYLVSAPMNNEIAIAMLFTLFGWQVTALYIGFGLLVAIVAGLVIDRLDLEEEVLIKPPPMKPHTIETVEIPVAKRLKEAWAYTLDILKKVGLYVLAGVGIGAWIHGYVPADLIVRYAGGDAWYSVPLATILGVPMYSNAAGVMPLIEVLTQKGMLMGTALSFMMAITALSLPEAMILKKILSMKLIAIFFSTVAVGIMAIGYLFNVMLA